MATSIRRSCLGWVILVPYFIGCQSFFATQGPPQDPLFLARAPIAAKAQYAPPVAIAYLEPNLPPDPFLSKNAPVIVDRNSAVPGTLTNRTKEQEVR